MKRIKVYVSMGLVGCKREETFEVPDDSDEKELEEIARETMFSLIDWGFVEVDENGKVL